MGDYVLQGVLNTIDRLYFHQDTIGNCVSPSLPSSSPRSANHLLALLLLGPFHHRRAVLRRRIHVAVPGQ